MMKTMRIVMLMAAMAAASIGLAIIAEAQDLDRRGITVGGCIRPDLDVYVWPDRGVDAIYYPGDEIRIYFEVTRDCYVVLYDIDTRGQLHILFPFDPWQDNFVQAGRVYELPGDWDDFALTVDGPAGDEYIQAIASPYPLDLPDWPIYINSAGMYPATCPDPEYNDFRAGHNRVEYICRINRKITQRHWEYCATDLARFYVHPWPVWPRHPRFIDIDPWPDIFYGDIYIGWPIGARIYIDGIFIGIAPCRVPRLHFGHHWIRCFDGDRLLREQRVDYRHKQAYRKDQPYHSAADRYRDDVFRTAPPVETEKSPRARKTPVIERDAAGKSPRPHASEREKQRTTQEKSPDAKRKGNDASDADKITVETTKKPSVDGDHQRRKGGLSGLVTDVGRVVAGELKKSNDEAQKSDRESADKSRDDHRREKSGSTKTDKTHISEKNRDR